MGGILNDKERAYLKAVIKPFRKRVKYIFKDDSYNKEYICIVLKDEDVLLHYFEPKTMYKGMELYKPYTLEDLGL